MASVSFITLLYSQRPMILTPSGMQEILRTQTGPSRFLAVGCNIFRRVAFPRCGIGTNTQPRTLCFFRHQWVVGEGASIWGPFSPWPGGLGAMQVVSKRLMEQCGPGAWATSWRRASGSLLRTVSDFSPRPWLRLHSSGA